MWRVLQTPSAVSTIQSCSPTYPISGGCPLRPNPLAAPSPTGRIDMAIRMSSGCASPRVSLQSQTARGGCSRTRRCSHTSGSSFTDPHAWPGPAWLCRGASRATPPPRSASAARIPHVRCACYRGPNVPYGSRKHLALHLIIKGRPTAISPAQSVLSRPSAARHTAQPRLLQSPSRRLAIGAQPIECWRPPDRSNRRPYTWLDRVLLKRCHFCCVASRVASSHCREHRETASTEFSPFQLNFMSTQQTAPKQCGRHEERQYCVHAKHRDMQSSSAGPTLEHRWSNEVDRMCERQQAGEVLK